MKTFIVAIDFSDASDNATDFAAKLAKQVEAKIILYNAFYLSIPPSESPILTPRLDQIFTEDKAQLEAKKKEIASQYNIPVECFSSPMSIVDQLPSLVMKFQADLVIIGMRGMNSFNRKLFGSTTVSILRIAKFPVLAIPEKASYKKLSNILFAYQPEVLSKKNKLKILKDLAELFEAKVKILHVILPEERKRKQSSNDGLETFIKFSDTIKPEFLQIEDDHFLSGINKGITETKANLLVMVPGEHNNWETLTNQSKTRNVVLHTYIPLLAIPNP